MIMKWIVKLTNEMFIIQDKDDILDDNDVSDLAEDEE